MSFSPTRLRFAEKLPPTIAVPSPTRVASQAAARFEQHFAVIRIAASLLGQLRTSETGLPDERRDRLNLVILQTELRHLGGGTEFLGMAEPVRDPLFVNLHTDFFQVRADLFGLLQQVVRVFVELLDLRVNVVLTVTVKLVAC